MSKTKEFCLCHFGCPESSRPKNLAPDSLQIPHIVSNSGSQSREMVFKKPIKEKVRKAVCFTVKLLFGCFTYAHNLMDIDVL